MENTLIDYFSTFTQLSNEEERVLRESMVTRAFKKGDYLLQEGHYMNETFFVLQGCVRQFRMMDGNDITTNIFTEKQWIIGDSLHVKSSVEYSLISMEHTIVVVGDEQKAREIFEQFPRLEAVSGKIMETAFKELQQQLATYVTEKPEQRYLRLLQTRPDLLQRIPQYDLATFIGVKPESLSRIRRKLFKK
jgi:CRP-like cAMP-binding protein